MMMDPKIRDILNKEKETWFSNLAEQIADIIDELDAQNG